MSDYEGVETAATVRIAGRVKWFDPGKGYGFIVPDDPTLTDMKDVLLHISSLRDAGRDAAAEGAPISCECARRPKGWQVTEVHDLGEGDPELAAPARRTGYEGLRQTALTLAAWVPTPLLLSLHLNCMHVLCVKSFSPLCKAWQKTASSSPAFCMRA